MNSDTLSLIQIVLGILMMALILLQSKGTGLGSTFGGEMALYRTKRGVEKLFFRLTLVIATLFLSFSIIRILV